MNHHGCVLCTDGAQTACAMTVLTVSCVSSAVGGAGTSVPRASSGVVSIVPPAGNEKIVPGPGPGRAGT